MCSDRRQRIPVDSGLQEASADAELDHEEAGPPAVLLSRDQSQNREGTARLRPIGCQAPPCRPHPLPPAPLHSWSRAPPCGPCSTLHPGFAISLRQQLLTQVGLTVMEKYTALTGYLSQPSIQHDQTHSVNLSLRQEPPSLSACRGFLFSPTSSHWVASASRLLPSLWPALDCRGCLSFMGQNQHGPEGPRSAP